MNYGQIVIDGHRYAFGKKEWRMLLTAYFKREALKAKEQHYEYNEFFYNCKEIIKNWKSNIKWQIERKIIEEEKYRYLIQQNGFELNGIHITDPAEIKIRVNELNVTIRRLKDDLKQIESNLHYRTQLREYPDVYLLYMDLERIEQGILAAEQHNEPAAPQQQITIPDNILQALQQARFIENAAARPLKWSEDKSKFLLAFFVEKICEKADNECISKYKSKYKNNPFRKGEKYVVKPFETLFNVTGLTAAKNDNKRGNGCNMQSEDCKTIETIIKTHNLFS
ncbi:MAG: hypothetical protein LBS69_10115 [Prevotellaceae bacterium]|jgi:hypothetical protein|nr:hypothetical protein [Prevotellaceae bacterium]